MKLTQEEQKLAREKLRHQELMQKYEQATRSPDEFVVESASRILRRAPAGTNAQVLVFTDRGEDFPQNQPAVVQEPTPEETPPFWQQWLRSFHIDAGR